MVEQPPCPGERATVVTFELQPLGEPLHHREEGLTQPRALGDGPLVVTVRKEVARIKSGSGLKRAAHVVGLARHLGARPQLLELDHVEPEGSVGSPQQRPPIAVQEPVDIREGAPQEMQGLAQIGAGLRFPGVGPEQERQALAGLRPVAVKQQVGKKGLQARRIDGGDETILDRDAEATEQPYVQAGERRHRSWVSHRLHDPILARTVPPGRGCPIALGDAPALHRRASRRSEKRDARAATAAGSSGRAGRRRRSPGRPARRPRRRRSPRWARRP